MNLYIISNTYPDTILNKPNYDRFTLTYKIMKLYDYITVNKDKTVFIDDGVGSVGTLNENETKALLQDLLKVNELTAFNDKEMELVSKFYSDHVSEFEGTTNHVRQPDDFTNTEWKQFIKKIT